MYEISRTIKDGADALRSMGLELAAQNLLEAAEQALEETERWFQETHGHIIKDAELALTAKEALTKFTAQEGYRDGFEVVPKRSYGSYHEVESHHPPVVPARGIPTGPVVDSYEYTPSRAVPEDSTQDTGLYIPPASPVKGPQVKHCPLGGTLVLDSQGKRWKVGFGSARPDGNLNEGWIDWDVLVQQHGPMYQTT